MSAQGDRLRVEATASDAIDAAYENQVMANAALLGQVASLTAERDAARSQVLNLQTMLTECQEGHEEPPPVEPEPHEGVLIGMSADDWEARLAEVGPGLQARRLFGQSDDFLTPASMVSRAQEALDEGMYPVLSFKVPSWAGIATGSYDAKLNDLAGRLADLDGGCFVCLHHEPQGDGTQTDFAAMQRRALPILNSPPNVDAGVILNGWWWTNMARKLTDAQIAAWLPADVREMCEIVGADFYQASSTDEMAVVKVRNFAAWAARVGISGGIGIGEYNSFLAADIKAIGDLVLADDRFAYACVWNTNSTRSAVLSGDRLTAFKATLAAAQ